MFPLSTRILVVDDMVMFRQMVKQALTQLEYNNFTEASNGELAWAQIEDGRISNKPFGLIISDWSMPKMKGIELLKKVRAESWGAATPFIMLTGETEKENIMEAVQAGVTQYILKPFNVQGLQEKMKSAYLKTHPSDPNAIVIK
jgi:two-component system chemotaxis response regulator CheY